MGGGFGQVITGAILFVFGFMVLGGFVDWLVDLIGALTMVLGLIMFAVGIMSGRRARH